jgi:hypothetical protein
MGVNRQLPHLGNSGMGVNRQLPHLGDAGMGGDPATPALGVDRGALVPNTRERVSQQLPCLSGDTTAVGRGVFTHEVNQDLAGYLRSLAVRLRRVRVCCGDWSRVMGPSVTIKHGACGVFLDPPYSEESERAANLYSSDDLAVAHDVRKWAIENEDNPLLRIALCGYEGEHDMPGSWECIAWKNRGGYGSQANGRGAANAHRERIWFSPHCLRPQESLFQ